MGPNRREFLGRSGLAGATATLGLAGAAVGQGQPVGPGNSPPRGEGRHPIGVSTYSFWQLRGGRLGIEDCLDKVAAMGFDGFEILHVQMRDEFNAALQRIKRPAHSLGLALMGFSTHRGFVIPDEDLRRTNAQKTLDQIDLAYRLGISAMRFNTGRWGTMTSFDDLMEKQGIEPAPVGHTDEEAFGWVIGSIEKLLPRAEECGVVLGLENHWGPGRTAEGVLRIVGAIESPWLRTTLDTGNLLERAYEQMEAMAASPAGIALVQAKTYFGGGRWYGLDLDYARIAAILVGTATGAGSRWSSRGTRTPRQVSPGAWRCCGSTPRERPPRSPAHHHEGSCPMMHGLVLVVTALAGLGAPDEPGLPTVLFLANPMQSDNDVIRRPRPDTLSVAERHFAGLSEGRFDATITQDGSEVTHATLARYQAVVFFTAINLPGVDVDGLVDWVRDGGAFVGIHSTANTYQGHPAFGSMLRARYDRRPWRTGEAPQTRVRVRVEDRTHPATRHLGESFEITDDIYQFKDFDRGKVRLLLSPDPASLDLENPKVNRRDRDFPVSWATARGDGRVFYTALGDWEETWKDPRHRTHLIGGIRWAMGIEDGH